MAKTRTRSQTKAELTAEEKSAQAAKRQAQKLKEAAPSKAELEARSRAAEAAARGGQAIDNKQSKTMGVVARGKSVKTGKGYAFQGEFVHADKGTIESLRQSGHLVDPGRVVEPMRSPGPRVLIEDAASKGVREPA